jgi:hypothetical protein
MVAGDIRMGLGGGTVINGAKVISFTPDHEIGSKSNEFFLGSD